MNWRPEIDLAFVLLAAFTIGSGIAAISLRNLIHCALCFATCLLGIAGSLVAGYAGQAMGWYAPGEAAGWIASVIGAIVLLVVVGLVRKKA